MEELVLMVELLDHQMEASTLDLTEEIVLDSVDVVKLVDVEMVEQVLEPTEDQIKDLIKVLELKSDLDRDLVYFKP